MGISSDGLLVYGYDLGAEDDWYDRTPDWLKAIEDSPDYDGFGDAVQDYLLEQSGLFTETDWKADGYWLRKHDAIKAMGIDISYHCSYEYPMYILTLKDTHAGFRAYRGRPIVLEADHLNIPPAIKIAWDAKLKWALDLIGLTPLNPEPSWILTSLLG